MSRKVTVFLNYNGKNVSEKVSEYLESFSYIDSASGESDSISCIFSNIDKRWFDKWMPANGDTMHASIWIKNSEKESDISSLSCGNFVIDDCEFSGRPLTATINAVSFPAAEGFKNTERTKNFVKATIESIASQIAKRYNMALVYDAESIQISSIKQSNQSDSTFLKNICEDYGLSYKIYSNKIIIYNPIKYEKNTPVATIDESDMLSWSYSTTLQKTYTAAEISYTNPKKGETIQVKVGGGNRTLKVGGTADNLKEAEIKALAKLYEENKKEVTMQITILGNCKITASSNVKITGLKKINGIYAVEKVTHLIDDGYTTSLELRKIKQNVTKNELKEKTNDTQEYIVKRGDTLWDISKRLLGSSTKYMEIYKANKEVIEETAKKHGKKNSENGWWIWEGTTLFIPEIGENNG